MGVKTIFAVLVLALGYMAYNFFDTLETFKKIPPSDINDSSCEVIDGPVGIEDFVVYSKEILIGGSNDNLKLFQLAMYNATEDGTLVVFNMTSKVLTSEKIEGFPKEIAFHPHGVSLFKNEFLYVINHAFEKGGERIEVIKVTNSHNKVSFTYVKSFPLPETFIGTLNDLAVINENEFYFTTSYYGAFDTKKNNIGFMNTITTMLSLFFKIRFTYVYHFNGKITKISNAKGLLLNGITFNPKTNQLYVIDTLARSVLAYQIDSSAHSSLTLIKSIDIGYGNDNINYDPVTNKIYVAIMGRVKDFLELADIIKKTKKMQIKEMYGGIVTIDAETFEHSLTLMSKNKMLSISNGYILNEKNVIVSSCLDRGFMVCKIK